MNNLDLIKITDYKEFSQSNYKQKNQTSFSSIIESDAQNSFFRICCFLHINLIRGNLISSMLSIPIFQWTAMCSMQSKLQMFSRQYLWYLSFRVRIRRNFFKLSSMPDNCRLCQCRMQIMLLTDQWNGFRLFLVPSC